MATSKKHSPDQADEALREALAASDKLIKDSEKKLKKIDKLRESIGLKSGAPKEFLDHIPQNSDKRAEAQKELDKFFSEANALPEVDNENKSQKKKRRNLNRAMRKNLRI